MIELVAFELVFKEKSINIVYNIVYIYQAIFIKTELYARKLNKIDLQKC